jgi:uncharacterized membrane protein YphA (DoxX/SURF4 family)
MTFPAALQLFKVVYHGDEMKPTLSKYIFYVTRLILGAIFIAASIDKIAHPVEFAKIVSNYQILPGNLINIVAIALPWLEALLGLFILCGWWLAGAIALANLLLITFLAALVFTVARGIDINCGCFSLKAAASPHTVWYLARDFLFLLIGAVAMVQVLDRERRPDGGGDRARRRD